MRGSVISSQIERALFSTAIEEGLAFLSDNQLPSGEFRCYRSRGASMDGDSRPEGSPFPTALICHSLSFVDSPKARDMIQKGGRFLLDQMESQGVWRYRTHDHPLFVYIPPDIDDTVCASSVLAQNGVVFPDNRDWIVANRDRHGRLFTWLIPRMSLFKSLALMRVSLPLLLPPWIFKRNWRTTPSRPDDVDGVVNANALYYLGKRTETKPIVDYLIRIVEENQEEHCDKWHLSPFNLYYAMSNSAYAGIEPFDQVRDLILHRMSSAAGADGIIGSNILETAMAICAFLSFRSLTPLVYRAATALLSSQHEGGEWSRHPLYFGGRERPCCWGSESLSTGFCLEALSRLSG